MRINWFPGHMNKARRLIGEAMPKVSLVVEVLDARLPHSSSNPLVPELRGDTPVVKLLNKRDLADPKETARWVAWLEREQGVRALPVSRDEPELVQEAVAVGRELVGEARWTRDDGVRAMILGIPNVGKSTLINVLAGKKVARTANKPAVTQQQQRVRVDKHLSLVDTPGFLWPRLEPPECGYRLAASGAIKDSILDLEDIAHWTLRELSWRYPEALRERFGLEELPGDAYELMLEIAMKRGARGRKGRVDLHRVAEIVLTELRSGKLGRISLEWPEDVPVPGDEGDEGDEGEAAPATAD